MYLGRVVGLGMLPDEREFIAYAVSGRSDASRTRKARITGEGNVQKVNIGPLGLDKLTLVQEAQAQWIFYNGIITSGFEGEEVYALASNGEQGDAAERILKHRTSDMSESHMRSLCMDIQDAAAAAMIVLRPERDKYKTPRIAGVLGNCHAYLGIITEDGYFDGFMDDLSENTGKMFFVSTYMGEKDSNEVVVPKGKVEIPMGSIDLHGEKAQELADNLYDWMDKDLVVCTAVALFSGDYESLDLAVRNLYGD